VFGKVASDVSKERFQMFAILYALGQHILQTYHLGRFCVNPCDENVLKCVEV